MSTNRLPEAVRIVAGGVLRWHALHAVRSKEAYGIGLGFDPQAVEALLVGSTQRRFPQAAADAAARVWWVYVEPVDY